MTDRIELGQDGEKTCECERVWYLTRRTCSQTDKDSIECKMWENSPPVKWWIILVCRAGKRYFKVAHYR